MVTCMVRVADDMDRSMANTSKEYENRLLRHLLGREPDAMAPTRMLSPEWRCDGCGEVFKTEQPLPCPAPCIRCGGVSFSTFEDWRRRSPH
jgi:rubrerythrin